MAATKKRKLSKPRALHSAKKSPGTKRWVKDVKTNSTHPREGLFKKDASTIARELASKEVSPKGRDRGCEC